MKSVTVMLAALVGLVNSIPGYIELREGLLAPPGQTRVFGAILIAASVVTVASVLLARQRIKTMRPSKVLRRSVIGLVVAAFLCLFYGGIRGYTVFQTKDANDKDATVYMPLFPHGELAAAIDHAGGRRAIVDRMPRIVEDWAQDQSGGLALTTALLLALYVGGLAALTYSMAIVGVRREWI